MPGLIIAYALRYDNMKSYDFKNGYYIVGLIGYSIGLFLAMTGTMR
jgi:hypothetical protein